MQMEKTLIRKIHETANIMVCDSRKPRCYGTDGILTYSDLTFLQCIHHHKNARAGEVSVFLGITNGAVAQLSKKLESKGFLEIYRLEDNRKEVYYRLTEEGQIACDGFENRFHRLNTHLQEYIQSLAMEQIQAIDELLELIVSEIEVQKDCYIKYSDLDDSENNKDRRCEKCKIIY